MPPRTLARHGLLVPLYVYPAAGAWEPLIQAITTYRDLLWTIIINPHNGPGEHPLPDTNYVRELPRLAAHGNVRLLGYVHITYTQRELGLVLQDVCTYSTWAESGKVNGLAVNGIFVDETPNTFDPISENYLSLVRDKIKTSPGLGPHNIPWYSDIEGGIQVVHNPGCIPDPAFRRLADMNVVFEDITHVFWSRLGSRLFESVGPRAELACIVHSIPSDMARNDLQNLVAAIDRVAETISLVSADQGDYVRFGPRWQNMVALIAEGMRGRS
ncbi:MAG: hypothetical protein Q9227_005378 [Pyrenula ochraceoflavens]